MCAAPGSKTAQIIECLHRDESNPIPSKSIVLFFLNYLSSICY
jgi:16S rRNA C967 or C1407 C5-methylase (RsmB/RsmF family)